MKKAFTESLNMSKIRILSSSDHKDNHKSVHMCNKHKDKVTYACTVPLKFDKHYILPNGGSHAHDFLCFACVISVKRTKCKDASTRKRKYFIFLCLSLHRPSLLIRFLCLYLCLTLSQLGATLFKICYNNYYNSAGKGNIFTQIVQFKFVIFA